MHIKEINTPHQEWDTIQQILYNRGMDIKKIPQYINLNHTVVNNPLLLGAELLKKGCQQLFSIINENKTVFLIVDCDCDGYMSAALFINYLYELFPTWVTSKLTWWMHEDKQHGLQDCIDKAKTYDMVVCIDGASNDWDEQKQLADLNIPVLILDHHLITNDEVSSSSAIIINNQHSDYPNKEFCGCGIAWQFCRYIDELLHIENANNFLDLVAIANIGDMMNLQSFETRYLISLGLRKENIHNPFLNYILDKNSFPLSKSDYVSNDKDMACTPMGAAFFIVPFINATTRSGTIEEKKLIFKALLTSEAFTRIPEIKRGKKTGKEELLVLQAIRTIGNVKNRQTRAEERGLELLELLIKENNLLDNSILLFTLENDVAIDSNIKGLVANKLAAKYQRPCLVLSRKDNEYIGSMRGYIKTGIESFKTILEQCPEINWVQGQHHFLK